MELISKFSSDAFRYYFMSQCPFGGDGEFSFERFADAYNSGLANNLGNLYSRILTMCVKYFDGHLGSSDTADLTAWRRGLDLPSRIGELRESMIVFDYSTAMQRIWLDVVDSANRYIQETEPFKLVKTDVEACRVVLLNLAEWLRVVAILIKPVLPRTAEIFYKAFNYQEARHWDLVCYSEAAAPVQGLEVRLTAALSGGKPVPLFPKIDLK
jgi:methionyl-tRNA synthetase